MFECKSESVSASQAYYSMTSGIGVSLYSYFLAFKDPNCSVIVQSYTADLVMFHYITHQLALLCLTVPVSCHKQMKHSNQKNMELSHYMRCITKQEVHKYRGAGLPGE